MRRSASGSLLNSFRKSSFRCLYVGLSIWVSWGGKNPAGGSHPYTSAPQSAQKPPHPPRSSPALNTRLTIMRAAIY